MRLTCPNCGAQYEVPAEVIPESGRDVQCSNCGDTWFQTHPDHPDVTPPTLAMADDASEGQDWDYDNEETTEDTDAAPEPDMAAEPNRRGLDPDVADVLREEAAREQQARVAEQSGGLETQPDLGLTDEGNDRTRQARSRMARLRGLAGEQEDIPVASDPDHVSRRNMLPEIDEIPDRMAETTEQPTDDVARDGSRVAPAPAGPGGFRRGFRLAVVLALLGTVVYVFAAQIATAIPAAESALSQYTALVDQARVLLHQHVGGLVDQARAILFGS